MKVTGQKEVSLVDPDSRLMRVDSQRLDVCYNIQTSVDARRHLIVDYDVSNYSTDHHQLTSGAIAAKETLDVDRLEVLSDKGYYVEKDVSDCEKIRCNCVYAYTFDFESIQECGCAGT